jgi:hypothetical protein
MLVYISSRVLKPNSDSSIPCHLKLQAETKTRKYQRVGYPKTEEPFSPPKKVIPTPQRHKGIQPAHYPRERKKEMDHDCLEIVHESCV